MIHLAIAEDNTFAMKAILQKVSLMPEARVKIKAFDGRELMEALAKDAVIDLVLMDIQMPVMDGIETTRLLKQKYPQVKVVMLTTFDDDEKIFEAILSGASGYLLKDESAESIVNAIQQSMNGGAPMSAGIALKVMNLVRHPLQPGKPPEDFGLTKREIELLEQLKNGLSYEQAAQNMFISLGTVQKHIQNIYSKLHVNNKVAAVQKATVNRLI